MTLKCCFLVLYKIRCFHVFLFPIGILKVFSRCEKTMFGSPPFLSVAQPGLRQVSWFWGTTVGSTDILIFQNVIPKCLSTGNGLEYRAQPGFQNSQICQFGGEGDSNLITLFGIISWKLTWNPGYTRLGQFTHQVPFLELTALTEPANLEGAEEVNFPQV